MAGSTLNLTIAYFLKQLQSITPAKKLLIAYSGGLDSRVLLHLTAQLPIDFKIRAMHIHHGLQKEADDWVNHCQKICDELNVPFQSVHLDLITNKGDSIEDIARKGRYQALKETLQEDEVLLTAHHQNDQAETILLQLFRGSGVQGLASMPVVSDFGKGQHARPLLAETRQNLESYARENKLSYINDPSNKDLSFDRNYLRQKIFPQLRERWLGIDKTLFRAASIQAETKELLDEIAEQDLHAIHTNKNNTLSIREMLELSGARQKLLIRHWIKKSGFSLPSEKKLKHIFSDVIHARKDAMPLVEWQGAQTRRFKDELYIMSPLSSHDSSQNISWNCHNPLEISSLGLIIYPEVLQDKKHPVTVRFRQGGEKVYIPERSANISLKNLLHDAGIPPWLRSRLPLIYNSDGQLIQIIGLSF